MEYIYIIILNNFINTAENGFPVGTKHSYSISATALVDMSILCDVALAGVEMSGHLPVRKIILSSYLYFTPILSQICF